jgi:hypothetical protein
MCSADVATRSKPSSTPSTCSTWTALICAGSYRDPQGDAASILRRSSLPGVRLNEHIVHPKGAVVFQHACRLGAEGIVSKRLGSRYRSGRSPDWLKFKNPNAPAVKREAEEDWGR